MTRIPRHPGRGQRGTIMVLVVTILAALLAGAAVALYLQVNSTRAAGLSSHMRGALYCAEAGLAAWRRTIADNYKLWPEMLDADDTNDPHWYPAEGDIDDDNVNDYIVTIRDNADEFPPDPLDDTVDSDNRIIIVSRCTKYVNAPREILEVISLVATPGTDYTDVGGFSASGTGNRNLPP